MFAAFSVYKICTYGVLEDMQSHQTPTQINQRDSQSNEILAEHNEVATMEVKQTTIPAETLETLRNLNDMIRDLREHHEELRTETETLRAQIGSSKGDTRVFQSLIADLKKQNEKLTAEVKLLRDESSGLEAQRAKMKRQRDEVSGILNGMMRKYAQENCDMLQMKKKAGEEVWLWVAETGGYCLKEKPTHYWDATLTESLSKFLANKTVLSFGEGPAYYQMELLAAGEVTSYTSYDASPFYEIGGPEKSVQFLDISVPQFGLPQADWVVCIEVGQHVPRRFEQVVVENLVRHAKEGVVLSWSPHGQGGYSQPNPRSGGHLIELFDVHDFKLNSDESKVLRDASKAGWLKRNLQVFRRKYPETFDPNSI